ncbi:SusC/RagA family TonB-linked outer membrane protein [Flavobacteriaceae bacterium]|nr:SusC/RagA family TonB-linked outer membrane protein [Flavobacteriaceae bacterium]
MKTKFSVILTLLLALVVQISFAQNKNVSGTVSDNNGLPLPGATVVIEGTSTGVSTDFDGNYSISASVGDVLVFSYVGYSNQSQTVGASNTINVSMVPDNALEEVVVEAYRTTSKETSSIASTTITAETIESRPNASFAQTLQGQVAGLNIVTNNGQPGGNSLINLRGVSSISGNTEPLFIIDGVPVDEDNFRSLNPNDIASLSVLKDAGATAIYGNRGANGVIIIKTKVGSYDQGLKVTYTGLTSFSNLQDNDYNLMNSREQLQLEKDYGSGFGATLSDVELEERALQANTDWLDVFFSTGITQTHTLNLSSGGKNINSFTSFGFSDTEGILTGASTLKRFNFRNNLNGKSNDGRFRYGTTLSLNYSESAEPNSIGSGAINRNFVNGALLSVPYISPYSYVPGEGGNIPVVFANTPLFLLDRLDTYTRRDDELKIIASVKASYDITDNLTFNSTLGADFTDMRLTRSEAPNSFNALLFAQTGNTTPGFEQRSSERSIFLNFNNQLNYRNTIDEKHTIDVSLFTEYFKAHWDSFGYFAEGLDPATYYPGDGSAYIDDNAANDNFVDTATANIQNAGLFSVFGYADYDYDKKYGLSATVRRDASYRFADSNKWGTFWSVAGRWNISNEDFMNDVSWVNSLKIRGSFGRSGNQRIVDSGGTFAPFGGADLTRDLFVTGSQYGGVNGITFAQIGNNALKWETVVSSNIGIDFSLFDRLRGSFDVYKRNTEDLFFPTPISPALNGAQTSISANVGELQNSGFDLELKYDLFKAKKQGDFAMTVGFVTNFNEQEIVDLPGGGNPLGLRVGGVISEIYAAPFVGVNPANGNLLFEDIDGNITEDLGVNDQRATGLNAYPDYQGSFGFDAEWKNFFVTTQFNYAVGVDRYDFDYSGFLDPTAIGQFRHSRDILAAWQQPGDITNIPSLTATNLDDESLSDRHLRSADYLRLRFMQVGYNVPKSLTDKVGFSYVRAFISGENLITWSPWKGLDAEGSGSAQAGYPTPKTFSIGLEFGF